MSKTYLIHRIIWSIIKGSPGLEKLETLSYAKHLLAELDPQNSNDPETNILAGKIEQLLYEYYRSIANLASAINYCNKAYALRPNKDTGIQLALLLTYKIDSTLDASREEKVADLVSANRIRKLVLDICSLTWNKMYLTATELGDSTTDLNKDMVAEKNQIILDQSISILLTRCEVFFGLGDFSQAMTFFVDAKEQIANQTLFLQKNSMTLKKAFELS